MSSSPVAGSFPSDSMYFRITRCVWAVWTSVGIGGSAVGHDTTQRGVAAAAATISLCLCVMLPSLANLTFSYTTPEPLASTGSSHASPETVAVVMIRMGWG